MPATYQDLFDYLKEHPERLSETITVYDDAGEFTFCDFLEMEVDEIDDERLVISTVYA